jgi:RNA polymerase sigma-70 factor (ECF subfamily)
VTLATDSDDFDELYLACRDRLIRQIYVFLGDETEARDLVQQAFEKAWVRWRHLRTMQDPEAWVRLVAFNLAKNHRRHARQFVPGTDAPERSTDAIEDEQSLMDFRQALARLPPDQRRSVILYHLVGMSVSEIAAEMSVADGTVTSWLHRGRTQLASELDDMNRTLPAVTERRSERPAERPLGRRRRPVRREPA